MKSNSEGLNKVSEKRTLLSIIRERSGKMSDHLLRHILFITNIFKRRLNGHKGRGRPRKTFIEKIMR